MWLGWRTIADRCQGAPEQADAGSARLSQKIQKNSKSLLTPRRPPDYIRLTNDGGDAAGDEEVRF
jgi:hypothetical protein